MQLVTRRFHSLLNSSWIAFLGAVASIISLIWFACLEIKNAPEHAVWILLLLFAVLFFLSAGIFSIKVRQENRDFRRFMADLHRINHDYRDTLNSVFILEQPLRISDQKRYIEQLKELEAHTLTSVCQKIAGFYTAFTHSKCTVTIKLIKQVGDKSFASAYVRSEQICPRDSWDPKDFELKTGRNTAFDKALIYAPATISHFHSWDLDKDQKEEKYRNERDNWKSIYRSTIVVPIRSVNPEKLGTHECTDDIGFLCVDTMATQRLNSSWHVELLAAFADQMYNFICLMRGKYALSSLQTS